MVVVIRPNLSTKMAARCVTCSVALIGARSTQLRLDADFSQATAGQSIRGVNV